MHSGRREKRQSSKIALSLTSPPIILMEMPPDCFAGGKTTARKMSAAASARNPVAAIITLKINRFLKEAEDSGMPRAPIPKNTPSRLKSAPLPVMLISATTALVAPLIAPPPSPIRQYRKYQKSCCPGKSQSFKTGKHQHGGDGQQGLVSVPVTYRPEKE